MNSSRALMDALLRGGSFDRVGLIEYLWDDTLARWVRQGYPTRRVYKVAGQERWRAEDGKWVDAEISGEYIEPVPPWLHFGFDMVGLGPWLDAMPLRGHDELIVETDEWEVRRNGAGASFKFWKHKMGTPEHMDFRMTSRAVWGRDYRPHLLELDPARLHLEDLCENMIEPATAGAWTFYGNIFVWELMRSSMGDITLYESLLLDPAWIHDYNQVYTDFFKRHFDAIFAQAGKPDGIWLYEDLGYKNGLFASPKVLEQLIFPYYREIVEYFHGYDLPVVLHSCGSQAQALPLIVEAGFDGLNPMERKARDNDPCAFADRYAGQLVFIGGLDVRILESNDRKLVSREVGHYIDAMKARGARLVFASDHSIPPTVQYDTYRCALDAYREHMWY